jgi:predicted AAA+ superfamily ATPase
MLSKENWITIIRDFHESKIPIVIPRGFEIDFESDIRRAISLIGPRRSGKTFEMYLLISKIRQKYAKDRALYINFERTNLQGLSDKDLAIMLETYYEIYPANKGKRIWLFLDEIQNVDDWERFVRTCLDEGLSVFLSGSSAKLLSKEIATSMGGRNISYHIYPFSFKEFLSAKNFEIKKFYSSGEKALLSNLLNEFIKFGGYPEAVLYSNQRQEIMQDIFDTAIYKDVVKRGKIRNPIVLQELINALLKSKEFSINKFYNYIKSRGIKTSKDALYKYAGLLEDAFFVFLLRKHNLSYKKSEQSLPKVYFVDNGLLTLNGIDEKGRLLENLVFVELMRRKEDIAYYQNALGEEVDFTVKEGKKVKQLIQVCYDVSNFMTLERETKILIKASEEFKCNHLLLINMHEEREQTINGKKIKFIPVWKWLLEMKDER